MVLGGVGVKLFLCFSVIMTVSYIVLIRQSSLCGSVILIWVSEKVGRVFMECFFFCLLTSPYQSTVLRESNWFSCLQRVCFTF